MQTDTTLAIETLLTLLIVSYAALLSFVLPKKSHIILNILFSGIAVVIGVLSGLSLDAMGLAPSQLVVGGIYAAGIILGIFVVTFIASRLPFIGNFFANEAFATASKKRLWYEAGFRVPLGTALIEEVIFRGLLLGLLLQSNSVTTALLVSSVVFGLWHIFPTVNQLEANQTAKDMVAGKRGRKYLSIVVVVLSTSLAGFCFGLLRIWSGSLLTPWLVHWAINAGGIVSSALTKPRINKKIIEK